MKAWRVNGDTILLAGIGRLVILLARLGRYEGAARLYGAATREIQLGALVPSLEAEITQLRGNDGREEFDTERGIGAALSYQAAADLATELILTAQAQFSSIRGNT